MISLRLEDVPRSEEEVVDAGALLLLRLVVAGGTLLVLGGATLLELWLLLLVEGGGTVVEDEVALGGVEVPVGVVVGVALSPEVVELSLCRFASCTLEVARGASPACSTTSAVWCADGNTPCGNFSGKYRLRRS